MPLLENFLGGRDRHRIEHEQLQDGRERNETGEMAWVKSRSPRRCLHGREQPSDRYIYHVREPHLF